MQEHPDTSVRCSSHASGITLDAWLDPPLKVTFNPPDPANPPNLALVSANKKKGSRILTALIDIIRRKVEKGPEIEIIRQIRRVVVHVECSGGHDWFAKRATWRRWCAGKSLTCDEAEKVDRIRDDLTGLGVLTECGKGEK